MGQPEGYINFKQGLVDDQHNVTDESVRKFLQGWVDAFSAWVDRHGRR
jgi:chromate reductase